MTISVAIPVYNEGHYLKACLQSLMSQDEKPEEIIVVNNNSTDNSVEVAKQFPVRIVNETHQGISYARNRGFDEVKSDIIARCDADTILPKNWISRITYDFENNSIDAVTGVANYDIPFMGPAATYLYLEIVRMIQMGGGTLIGYNMAFKKEIWEKIKDTVCMDNHTVHEDVDLALHINKIGGKIMHDRKLIVKTSGRRIKEHPISFFIEYPKRFYTTLKANHR